MNNRAYTLIELIVVMSLISTLLVLAIPSLKDTMAAHPVRSEARKLADCIGETRNRAVREQVDYVLHVDLDKGRFRASRTSDPVEMQQQSGIRSWALPEGIRITGIHSGNGEMQKAGEATVLLSGQGYAQPAVIHLRRDDCAVSLTISPFLSELEIRDEPAEDLE
ncbi:prepilin-type N-terminal cleavage/methylation domain-containing protein [Syntrophus aciditrophicus]|uniref:Hypothetical membrane protein n=1 Tax=Syntrophus aciditrophicus (strain SB) TaxID=56780 RepID=Q2LVK4_SYNAS|nr:prepilin-type N-terminal cleavage/methylation domain-containing protein [Syntrophus aciditrophicus]ABC78110.1 hypothetical membrane protein [Syntrophus aciditrophicus SB]